MDRLPSGLQLTQEIVDKVIEHLVRRILEGQGVEALVLVHQADTLVLLESEGDPDRVVKALMDRIKDWQT